MDQVFEDRVDAGKQLAVRLEGYRGREDVLVLALPRGGVPIGFEIARELGLALDVLIVRKVGLPGNPELAMGAVASGGVEVVNESVVRGWGIAADEFMRVAEQELKEIERRESSYRQGRPLLEVEGKTVLLVDDGIATGSTMKAAIAALRKMKVQSVVVAVPVAANDSLREMGGLADEVVCVQKPDYFRAVGMYYRNFSQTSDDEVTNLLARAQAPHQ